MDLSIFIKYYLDKDSDYQLSIDKIFLIKVQALAQTVDLKVQVFSLRYISLPRARARPIV